MENEDGEEKDHALELVGGMPWRADGGEGDDDYREKIREEASGEVVPRRMYIKKSGVEEHGYTVRCLGCISIQRRTTRQEHSDACRRRLEKEMEGTQKAMNAKARVREYVEKKMEGDEQARKRKKGEEKEEKGEVVSDKMNVKGDKMMEEARERRKRGESDNDDVVKRAKRSSSGQVSAEGTMKILRKLEREERKR